MLLPQSQAIESHEQVEIEAEALGGAMEAIV